MILVTGATGKVGSATVLELRRQDRAVRALVRDPQRARVSSDAGADIAVGDFGDPASLRAAMDGVTGVVLIGPGGPPEQELAVVGAAAEAGVGHVVKLTSRATLDSPIARQRWHAQVEQGLAASGLPHTLLRSNAFMQTTLMFAPGIAATGSFASSVGTGRMGLIDTRDVAAVAAVIAADPADHAGATYSLSGPERLAYADVATILSRVLGRTVTYQPSTRADDEAAMIAHGLPQPVAAMNAHALALFAEGSADWLSDDVGTLLSRPARGYEEFATDHVGAFS